MVRALCALAASMTLACTTQWKSHVTLVRPTACETKVGDSCVYTYESHAVDRDGRCAGQQAPAGERLVACDEHQEGGGPGPAIAGVLITAPIVLVTALLWVAYTVAPVKG